ncbi:DUF2339 domain-containing protein, partial [Candidatus Kaiserbacteria bacterium]|nr:DUF2339 domain-containing protein [Candidatus Kaiserbacteria bacterium]
MGFISFLFFVYAVYLLVTLSKRVTNLEQEVAQLSKHKRSTVSVTQSVLTAVEPAVAPESETEMSVLPRSETEPDTSNPPEESVNWGQLRPIPTAPPAYTPVMSEPSEFFLYTWFREQTLIKVGSIIFFLGAVWFVSYAIEQNWIAPFMRIVLGLLLAVAVYVVGYWRRTTEGTQYVVLTTLGTAVFLGTVVASQFAFTVPILAAPLAFLLMVGSIAYTVLVAVKTKTEWLATTAALAGLLVPFLIKQVDPSEILLLSYLFLLSAGFLMVVFFTAWRSVALLLSFGTAQHVFLIYQESVLSDLTTWFFVIIFSILFFASTTVSIMRTERPVVLDVVTLVVVSLQFIGYAMAVALFPALALFVAATITALVGYILYQRNAHADAVSLYAVFSLACILLGTAELFDGFVLTIAYAIEVLAIYVLALKLATVQRTVMVGALLFVIPLLLGSNDLASSAWQGGVLHREALGVLSVILSLGVAVVYVLRQPAWQDINWLRSIAATHLVVWYGFVIGTCSVIAYALRGGWDPVFTDTFLTLGVAVIIIGYLTTVVPRANWLIGASFSLIVPTFLALSALTESAWRSGIWHQSFFASVLFSVTVASVGCVYWMRARGHAHEGVMQTISYALAWVFLGYGFMFLSTVWSALLSGDEERVVSAVSFLFVTYVVVSVLMLARMSVGRVVAMLAALVVPIIMLIDSLPFTGWHDGLLSIDAVGVYAAITVLFVLGTSLLHYRRNVAAEAVEVLQQAANILYGVAGILVFCLVWVMSQTVFVFDAVAVTIALFVYTVVGLVAYSIGRTQENAVYKRVGVLLLAAVVLRLGLVDVWVMETVWRIVTFLGIGLLFIGTALLERSPKESVVIEK